MRKKWRDAAKLSVLFAILLIAPGCWDQVDLQDVAYVTGLGIEYEEGMYIVYAHIVSPTAVAKTEERTSGKDESWTGIGKGDSLLMAMNDLTKVSQFELNMDHIKVIVLQSVAFNHMNDIFDGLNRQRATRGTTWVYGTKGEVERFFATDTVGGLSPLDSLLYNPRLLTRQSGTFLPVKMHRLMQTYKEPAMTAQLPSITVTERYWKEKEKKLRVPDVDGLFLFKNEKNVEYMSSGQAAGMRWVNREFSSALIKVDDGRGKSVTVFVDDSNADLAATWGGAEPAFALKVTLIGHVVEMDTEMAKEEIARKTEEAVRAEVLETYDKSVRQGADPFQLEHHLFRYYNGRWKKEIEGKGWEPRPGALKVTVKCKIASPGKYDLRGAHKERSY